MTPLSKPGKHGPLFRYQIRYRDDDPGCPIFSWCCWAYSSEHARDKFLDIDDGWIVLSVALVPARLVA